MRLFKQAKDDIANLMHTLFEYSEKQNQVNLEVSVQMTDIRQRVYD